jgi:hypothetical protein
MFDELDASTSNCVFIGSTAPNLDHAMTAQRVDAGRLGVDDDLAHE